MAETNCRHFSGYKPCGKSEVCESNCSSLEPVSHRILIVHLGAMGAVVRSTALLKSIKKKYQNAHITWVTAAPTDQLLRGHERIDRVLTTSREDILALSCLKFDVSFVIDKSLAAVGVARATKIDQLFGFTADQNTGAILPANVEAEPLWQLGLSNFQKFFVNKKTESELVFKALNLDWSRDDYDLNLLTSEADEASRRRQLWARGRRAVVGLNTGCSNVIAYKKLTIEAQRRLVTMLNRAGFSVVLLGGPEDTLRNEHIAQGLDVISSSTTSGLRDGLISTAAVDIVVTGDSLGMHLAIAMKKWVVAWFGPTCAHEIDLYDRGEKILSAATCGPCWRRSCNKPTMCYDLVDLNQILAAVERGLYCKHLSSTPRLSEIYFSAYRSLDL